MSQAVGRPVRVQWMRNDEHVWEHYGQPVVVQMKGGLDASNNLVAWDYNGWIASRGGRPGNIGAANLPTGFLVGLTLPATRPAAPRFPPLGSDSSNTVAGYLQDEDGTVPNARVIMRTVDSPFFTGPLRSPARIQNTFVNESFVDELAAAAGADPIEFRLRSIGDWRLKRAVEIARDKFGWKAHPAAQNVGSDDVVTGRGFSAMQYEGSDGYAAIALEIQLNRKTGKIKATRIVVTHDVGIVINPDGLRAQIEGNIVQGLGRSLREEVKLGKSSSESIDWESYQILRFLDLPKAEIFLINRPDQPAVGAGENAMTAIPAAMANAIFDATGKRLRRLPFTPARVKEALQA